MRTIALFVDDVASARLALRPLLASEQPVRVIVAACAPKLTRHVGRWLNNASREQYRQRWARELFSELQPLWSKAPRGTVETLTVRGALQPTAQKLRQRHGTDFIAIDARSPQPGGRQDAFDPLADNEARQWVVPAAAVTSGLGLALALVD